MKTISFSIIINKIKCVNLCTSIRTHRIKRSSFILNSLIKIYMDTHKPISSDQLAPIICLSGSTVRKELQELEARGFIYKPAPSA